MISPRTGHSGRRTSISVDQPCGTLVRRSRRKTRLIRRSDANATRKSARFGKAFSTGRWRRAPTIASAPSFAKNYFDLAIATDSSYFEWNGHILGHCRLLVRLPDLLMSRLLVLDSPLMCDLTYSLSRSICEYEETSLTSKWE